MAFEFKLPDIGEGVVEGEVVSWKVKEGEVVALDAPMVEVMTDKATVEIPAPVGGTVAAIKVAEGDICAVGQVLIVIDDGSADATAGATVDATAKPEAARSAGETASNTQQAEAPRAQAASGGRVRATPATRRLARQLDVELGSVTPTGRNGRVTSDDVRGHGGGGARRSASTASAPGGGLHAGGASRSTREPTRVDSEGAEERFPFRGMRKAIAANMVRSKFTATHFTYVEEVDMTEMVRLRTRAKESAQQRGIKLTYLPFIVKAAIAGLRKWPSINASLDETTEEIVHKKYYHLGIATQGPQGLSVGVVRDAHHRSILDIAQEIQRLSDAIRDGKASREDLTGSTFTISSLGQLGGVLATPIINFPESAIMGIHKIAERPAVVDGQIAIRHLMNLSISVDHRIADGYDGAMFLQEVKSLLEDPTLLFMELV